MTASSCPLTASPPSGSSDSRRKGVTKKKKRCQEPLSIQEPDLSGFGPCGRSDDAHHQEKAPDTFSGLASQSARSDCVQQRRVGPIIPPMLERFTRLPSALKAAARWRRPGVSNIPATLVHPDWEGAEAADDPAGSPSGRPSAALPGQGPRRPLDAWPQTAQGNRSRPSGATASRRHRLSVDLSRDVDSKSPRMQGARPLVIRILGTYGEVVFVPPIYLEEIR